MGEELVGHHGAAQEQHTADDQPSGPLGGDVEHHQEQAEEQEAGAEVALEDQDAEADQPHHQDRAEVAAARQVDAAHPTAGERQRVAMQHEVARERDHQQHLGDLAGLEAERPDADPDPGAVDGVADPGHERQQEQHDRGQPAGVGEAGQHPVVAQQHQRGDEEDHPERHPGQLLRRQAVRLERVVGVGQVEAVDDREAQSVERGHDRQQHGVGVRRHDPDHDVCGDRECRQTGAVPDDVGRHLALDADADRCVGPDSDGQREDEQEQLRAPAAPVHEAHDEPCLRHQQSASGSAVIWPARLLTVSWASSRLSTSMPSRTLSASKSHSRSRVTLLLW